MPVHSLDSFVIDLELTAYRFKLLSRSFCRQGTPAIAVAQQHNEVRARRSFLAALNLAKTDFHGLLIISSFLAHSPAQVDQLEARAVLLAEFAQVGE
ncbi:MAG: hypothetical protein WA130_22120 [Candidatus Methanoperedens sp.]